MRSTWGLVAAVVLVTSAGCAAQQPQGLSEDEVRAFQEAEARQWWEQVFPDEPMPDLQVQEYATPDNRADLAEACTDAFEATIFDRPPTTDELNRATWTCWTGFPLDPAGETGYLSDEQLEYGYAYLTRRSVPCLRSLGFDVRAPLIEDLAPVTSGDELNVLNAYPAWSPYWFIPPAGEAALRQAIERCPPPPGSGWTPLLGG